MSASVFDAIEGLAVCMIRPGVALSLLPFGSSGPLGKALRIPLVLTFAALAGCPAPPPDLLHAVVIEVLIGIAFGLALSVVFHVAATAGALLDQQAGYTIGAVYDPGFSEEASVFQTLFTQFAALTFFSGDGLKAVAGLFANSWTLWPPGRAQGGVDRAVQLLATDRLAWAFAEGLRLAAPLLVLLILVDVSLGLTARHAKRLNPFATARPLKVMLLSLAVAAATPAIVGHLLHVAATAARLG